MPKANLSGCRDTILEVAGESLSKDEAQSFIDALDNKIRNMGEANIQNLEERIKTLGTDLTDEMSRMTILNKRNALFTIKAGNAMEKHVDAQASPTRGYLSFLESSRRFGNKLSAGVDAIIDGWKDMYLGKLKSELFKGKLMDAFTKDMYEKEIFQEAHDGEGSSGSPAAKGIRDIMVALKQDEVERSNRYGSYIKFLPEHVVRQTYSINLIKKNFGPERFQKFINFDKTLTPEEYNDTFQNFLKFILPKVDHEKTFKDTEPEAFLRGMFDNIMTGRHGMIEKADGAEINTAFFKAGALANKVSQQRLLHYKDGDSAYAAFKAFSALPLSKAFIVELEHTATNIGLMQQMGPSPQNMLAESITRKIQEYGRMGEEKKMLDLQAGEHRILSAMSYLDRSVNIPENPTLQTATAATMSLIAQAKLGKLFFFALPDRALMQSMLTRNGMRGMDALATVLNLTKPSNPEERTRLMMLGGEIKSFLNAVQTRFSTGSESGVPSAILNTQRHFFNLTGINWIDDVGTDAIVGALPRHLGTLADKDFNGLMPELQLMFKQYGINPSDWDAWRSTVYHTDAKGNPIPGKGRDDNWITPDAFSQIPDSVIDSLLKESGQGINDQNRLRQRDLLDSKFRTWLTAQKNEGVLMPGSREHRLATFGTQAGTVPGSLARILMMFKTFPISVYTKIMEREMFGSGARTFLDWMKNEKNTNFHTTQLIALSTIAGYISLQLDELLQGKDLRKFTNDQGEIDASASLQTARDSFLRGNAASLLGDLILRNYDAGENNIVGQLGGPAVNELIKGTALVSQGVRGQATPKQAINFLKDNLPWVNMFYTKPVLDHLVWFNIQEMLDPGSLRQYEIRHKEKYNQEYWLAPSEINQKLH